MRDLPDGEENIVFDRLHIMQHRGKAVDTDGRQERRAFSRPCEG